MHRRVLFLAVVTAAVLGLVGSATAMRAAKSSSYVARSPYAASFAKASASIPRTPAARQAKKTMVFGLEQGVTGFNTGDADENAYYAAIVAGEPLLRGNYVIDNKGNYHLDMASKVVATKKYLKIWIRKDANWFWVGHKAHPVTASDYIYTWQQFVNSDEQRVVQHGLRQHREGEGQWQEGRDLLLADVGLHGHDAVRRVRRLPRPVRAHLSGLRAQGLGQRVRRWLYVQPVLAHRRVSATTTSRSRTARSTCRATRRARACF